VTTTSISGERRFVSDWYFACLDGTWDADGDGRYAEQSDPSSNDPGDNADVVPELSVGRAPVSTRAGARRFVDKTLAYEQRRDDGFENTALMFANQLLPGVLDFASLAEQILPLLADDPALQISRLYETFDNPAWVPGALPETPQAVLAALNRGANVTIGMGAGSPDLLEAGPRASPAPYLTTDDILSLSNGDRAGHVWLLTSLVGAFDHPISLAEAFLDAPAGGAVTVIAPSDLVFSNEGFTLVRRLAEVAFEEGVPSIGEALIQARAGMPVSAASLAPLSYQLLGDPMLRITSSSPVATAHGPDRGRTGILGATTPAGAEHDVPLVIRERTASVPPAPKAEAVQFALSHPSPSPCTQTARVVCTVPQQLAGAGLRVDVLDLSGRTVSTLMSERARGGTVSLAWDLRSDHGARVPAGVYFVRVAIGDVMRSVRLVVTD
jgi:hypothetical protein